MQQRVREWCSLCTARVRETKQWSPPNLEDYEFVAILGHGTTSGDDVTASDDGGIDIVDAHGHLARERTIIEKDLNRFTATSLRLASMRDLVAPFFTTTSTAAAFHGSIRRILHCYQKRRRSVGYTQGMHVVVGTLLAMAASHAEPSEAPLSSHDPIADLLEAQSTAFLLFCALMERALPRDFLTPPPAAMNGLMCHSDILAHLAQEMMMTYFPGRAESTAESIRTNLTLVGSCAMVQLFADVVPLDSLLVVFDALFRSIAHNTHAADSLVQRRSNEGVDEVGRRATFSGRGRLSRRNSLHVESTGLPLLAAALALLQLEVARGGWACDAAPNTLLRSCASCDAPSLRAAMRAVRTLRGRPLPYGALEHGTSDRECECMLLGESRVQLLLHEAKRQRAAAAWGSSGGGGSAMHGEMLLTQLQRATAFSRTTLEKLMRAMQHAADGEPGLSATQFVRVLKESGVVDDVAIAARIFAASNSDGTGRITFNELSVQLSVLCHGTIAARLELCFDCFDEAHAGVLDRTELLRMIHFLLRSRPSTAPLCDLDCEAARWMGHFAAEKVDAAHFVRAMIAAPELLRAIDLPCFGFILGMTLSGGESGVDEDGGGGGKDAAASGGTDVPIDVRRRQLTVTVPVADDDALVGILQDVVTPRAGSGGGGRLGTAAATSSSSSPSRRRLSSEAVVLDGLKRGRISRQEFEKIQSVNARARGAGEAASGEKCVLS